MKLPHSELMKRIVNLTGRSFEPPEIARLLNYNNSKITNRANRNSNYSEKEMQILSDALGIDILNNVKICENYDQVAIPYIEIPGIDENLIKSPRIKERLQFDLEIIENEWLCRPENLRIIKCGSHMMDGGDYPIRMNNILLVDITATDIRKRGVYLYTTHDNKHAFIHGLWRATEETVQSYYFNPSYTPNVRPIQELKEINFKVYGRIVKNLSLTI